MTDEATKPVGRAEDLRGMKFGSLTVLGRAPDHVCKSGQRMRRWNCICDCGNEKQVLAARLKDKSIQSCGCHRRMILDRTTHGGVHDRLYHVWNSMKMRCTNPNHKNYKDYGGRGISVCLEWTRSYSLFAEWAYSHGYNANAHFGECTIDRIDVDGNYEPGNCRFANSVTQANNKRRNKNVK